MIAVTTPPVATFFNELGSRVAARWRPHDTNMVAFTEIATDELTRRPPAKEFDYHNVLGWALDCEEFPFQQEFGSHFGQPPITLYWHPRFFIQALFWTTSTTAIHNHAFAGAFSILSGSSLQTTFTFGVREAITGQVELGTLSALESALLPAGATQSIRPGEKFVHSAWHVGMPSVTIVVRTHGEATVVSRREYIQPHVAVDPFWSDQQLSRRLQCLQALATVDSAKYAAAAERMVGQQDFFTVFMVARQFCGVRINDRDGCRDLLERAADRWPQRADCFLGLYEEAVRRAVGSAARRELRDLRVRLGLGLLLVAPNRPFLIDAYRKCFAAADPVGEIILTVTRLAAAAVLPFEVTADSVRWLEGILRSPTGSAPAALAAGSEARLRQSVMLRSLFEEK